MATKRTTKRRPATFHRHMYPDVPFCEACFAHHAGPCPSFAPSAAYRCPCEFRKSTGLRCVAGATHPSRATVAA